MGRVLILVGILMLVGGIGMMGYSMVESFGITLSPQPTPDAAQYCREDEKLVIFGGASEYTPGQGRGRTVVYYCENAEGEQRDVTGSVLQTSIGNTLGMLAGGLGTGLLTTGLMMLGSLLLVAGIMVSAFRGSRRRIVTPVMTYQMTGQSNNPTDLSRALQQLEAAYRAGQLTEQEYQKAREALLMNFNR
ncbi:MAG: SHOCT domain-containing protein [Anaerolineae bacterium]|jgi:hypothetical protein|nr:SHOCT domain-containing protein [Anaerolineae bacterium]